MRGLKINSDFPVIVNKIRTKLLNIDLVFI